MKRLQLFEFEDLPWFPQVVREAMTDYLAFMGAVEKPYLEFVELLGRALERTGDDTLLDLCSGGGGPALPLVRLLSRRRTAPIRVVLTDLYPNRPRFDLAKRQGNGLVDCIDDPVDATNVPEGLRGFRLMSNSFHHLPPETARECLADAARKRRGIAVCEMVSRSPASVLQIGVGTLTMFAVTPFIRPFRWSRLLLTYALPIVPLCTLWDGVVSCLRAYDVAELRELTSGLEAHGYRWEIGRLPIPRTPAAITYLIGTPASA
ncbi:MAG: class I SAM-dependent methyltransferase [Myxococcota bacterium]